MRTLVVYNFLYGWEYDMENYYNKEVDWLDTAYQDFYKN